MQYLIAFDKFKGAISAAKAVDLGTEAVQELDPHARIECVPLTDGGEGFATIIAQALEGELYEIEVPGPRFSPVKGLFSLVDARSIPEAAMQRLQFPASMEYGKIGFVEMASASGFELLKDDERDPWETTTIGTGMLIKAAIQTGASAIVLGIGGSATNDCGAGALEALGVEFYDRELNAVTKVTPSEFKRINTTGSTSHLSDSFPPVRIACDVTNPLIGETGATQVFGPQKGLQEEDLEKMERTIRKMGSRILGLFGKPVEEWDRLMLEPGSGAAGGIGFALVHALPDSTFVEGFPLVSELLGLKEKFEKADIILSGEGRLDKSSLEGKGPVSLIDMAEEDQEVILLCGSTDQSTSDKLTSTHGNLQVIAISNPKWPLKKALGQTARSLKNAVKEAVSSY
jgi:glycerate kinase